MSQDSDNSENRNLPPTLEPAQPALEDASHSSVSAPQGSDSSHPTEEHPQFTHDSEPGAMAGNWKSRFTRFTDHLKSGITRARLPSGAAATASAGKVVRGFDPESLLLALQRGIQSGLLGTMGTAATILICSWFLSDISSILLERFIPEPPPARLGRPQMNTSFDRFEDPVQVITARNLFSSQGLMPGEETAPGAVDPGGAPVKTTLPFNLIGTLILTNELRSIATIEDKSSSQVYPVRIDDEIPGKARIIQIESRMVTFLNLSSNRREYVELPPDSSIGAKISLAGPSRGGPALPSVETVGANQFNVTRAAVDQALSDLPKVLTQARAVPNIENGVANGYKLFQIVPGSIYQTIGLQNGDTLMALDGNPMNDPAKAFELLNQLKTSSRMELTVKRNGKVQNFTYEIR